MKGRDLLTLADFTKEELHNILRKSSEMKSDLKCGNYIRPYLGGKTVILLFQSPRRERASPST